LKAIVLCGGLGTRLGDLTRDLPKPLLEVAGNPFLTYVLDQLVITPVEEIILAVGFQWQKIQIKIGNQWRGVKVSYSIEEQALGTGGAIKRALAQFELTEAIVVNGDTLLKMNAALLVNFAQKMHADICIALKMIPDTGRFGTVEVNRSGQIIAFKEKGGSSRGLINSGVYFVKASAFRHITDIAFSFENDILTKNLSCLAIYGVSTHAYFIDMGVPEDFSRAQNDLALMKEDADEQQA
jgi:D-glycero-alpha-D-manno-heptose 1-phosphate guanylyltransferase